MKRREPGFTVTAEIILYDVYPENKLTPEVVERIKAQVLLYKQKLEAFYKPIDDEFEVTRCGVDLSSILKYRNNDALAIVQLIISTRLDRVELLVIKDQTNHIFMHDIANRYTFLDEFIYDEEDLVEN